MTFLTLIYNNYFFIWVYWKTYSVESTESLITKFCNLGQTKFSIDWTKINWISLITLTKTLSSRLKNSFAHIQTRESSWFNWTGSVQRCPQNIWVSRGCFREHTFFAPLSGYSRRLRALSSWAKIPASVSRHFTSYFIPVLSRRPVQ